MHTCVRSHHPEWCHRGIRALAMSHHHSLITCNCNSLPQSCVSGWRSSHSQAQGKLNQWARWLMSLDTACHHHWLGGWWIIITWRHPYPQQDWASVTHRGSQFHDTAFSGFFFFLSLFSISLLVFSGNHFLHTTLKCLSQGMHLGEPTPRPTASPLKVETKVCAMTHEVLCAQPPAIFPLVHSTPTMVASWLFLEHSKHAFKAGPALSFPFAYMFMASSTILRSRIKTQGGPRAVFLSGLGIILQSETSLVQFPVRAQAWVVGLVPSQGMYEKPQIDDFLSHQCFSHSLSPSMK